MSIVISQNGKNARKIDKSPFANEDYLQEYIRENPDSIPVYEIEEDKKLFVIKREFSTGSGEFDALAIDKDGDIYVVETKLYKNADKRRVVAQALDYGASLWLHCPYDEFIVTVNNEMKKKFSISFEEKLIDFFGLDEEEIVSVLEAIKNNLQQGVIKFVILMDTIEDRLKDLIIYINKNSKFDIYAVQMEYYKFDKYEIMIPKLFGAEGKSEGPQSTRWTDQEFLTDAKDKINDGNNYKIFYELYEFITKNADVAVFGKGSEAGTFTFKIRDERAKSGLVAIFTLTTFGNVWLRVGNIRGNLGHEYAKLYFDKLKNILPIGLLKEEHLAKSRPKFPLNKLFKDEETIKRFKDATMEYVREVKK